LEVHKAKVRIYPVFSMLLGRCIARSFSLVARFIGSQQLIEGTFLWKFTYNEIPQKNGLLKTFISSEFLLGRKITGS